MNAGTAATGTEDVVLDRTADLALHLAETFRGCARKALV